MRQLSIGVDSWIIQDGNYGDFAVGDKGNFALEFVGGKLVPSTPGERNGQLLHTSVYRVKAEVIYARPDVWVIDFGVRAFSETAPPAFAQVGSWVEGDIFVGIDPFFYMEYLHKLPDMPSLFYDWKVEAISRDDTPWLSTVNERGGVTLSRDTTRVQWTEVERTLAWDDDKGRSSYVLRCANSDV
jgi:hypothetical protein